MLLWLIPTLFQILSLQGEFYHIRDTFQICRALLIHLSATFLLKAALRKFAWNVRSAPYKLPSILNVTKCATRKIDECFKALSEKHHIRFLRNTLGLRGKCPSWILSSRSCLFPKQRYTVSVKLHLTAYLKASATQRPIRRMMPVPCGTWLRWTIAFSRRVDLPDTRHISWNATKL